MRRQARIEDTPILTFRRVARALLTAMLALAFATGPASAQDRSPCPVAQPGHVVLYGDMPAQLAISFDELKAMPRVTVGGSLHDGGSATFEGVTLRELLTRAGVQTELRSGDLVRYVVIEAADGYRAILALAELDPAFTDALPILADTEAGRPIDPEFGPLQVIVPGELRHARWVRQVTCIRLARDAG